MADIRKQYPGKSADEIFSKVHEVMDGLAKKMDMAYQADRASKTGKVSKMGASGSYEVRDGEVSVALKFPMLVPGSVKKKVEEEITRKLDGLFS